MRCSTSAHGQRRALSADAGAPFGLDAPVRHRVDVITHDQFMQAWEQLEREISELEHDGTGSGECC